MLVLAAVATIAVLRVDRAEVVVGTPAIGQVDEDAELRRLIARGQVPGSSYVARPSTRLMPLYSPAEQETMRLVASGVLPQDLLDTDDFVTKRLVNQGLIPAQTVQ